MGHAKAVALVEIVSAADAEGVKADGFVLLIRLCLDLLQDLRADA
ncbi:hypothetical protein PsAD37_01564 [Pseudovibrio sp. Ad37]|nr:hypothetical protein PsAD37_01564 [Pseudovibrio sp. Ad37]